MSNEAQGAEPLAFTVREVAESIRMHPRSVWRAIARGDLEALHIGRLVRIRREALMRFLAKAEQKK
jgi:excisionase family DNA binding protein